MDHQSRCCQVPPLGLQMVLAINQQPSRPHFISSRVLSSTNQPHDNCLQLVFRPHFIPSSDQGHIARIHPFLFNKPPTYLPLGSIQSLLLFKREPPRFPRTIDSHRWNGPTAVLIMHTQFSTSRGAVSTHMSPDCPPIQNHFPAPIYNVSVSPDASRQLIEVRVGPSWMYTC